MYGNTSVAQSSSNLELKIENNLVKISLSDESLKQNQNFFTRSSYRNC